MDKELKSIVDSIKKYKEEMPLKVEDYLKLDQMVNDLESIKPERILLKVDNLTSEVKFILISKFHEWYYNTDQDHEVYAAEFYSVVEDILHGHIPVKLQFLSDYTDLLIDVVPGIEFNIKQRLEESSC